MSEDFAQLADHVRRSSAALGAADTETRNALLQDLAIRIDAARPVILAANAADMSRGRDSGLSDALLDRLFLDDARIDGICDAVNDIAALDDPLAEVVEDRTLENGLQLKRVKVPFGVVCVVYEARPNVTADAAAIAIKTGNGAMLRGSTQAQASNEAIIDVVREAIEAAGFDAGCVVALDPTAREEFTRLIATEGAIDLVIPRGGEGLKKFLLQHARVPVLAAAGGNNHVYVDASADHQMAIDVVVNAKTQRPGVCNAAETLLIHTDRVADLLPRIESALAERGVEIRTDEESLRTEFLDLVIAVKTVSSVNEAIAHINEYGTKHSEAIITQDDGNAATFCAGVDAACVYVNASTRFTDGGVFGLGAEVGISTNKLHARGPIGLRELTTYKYVLHGDGQVRT